MPTLKTLITKNNGKEEKLIDNKWNICKKKFRQYLYIYTKKIWKILNFKLSVVSSSSLNTFNFILV